MANYKKYDIVGASKYEVTHDGRVFNKNKDKKLGVREDGRVKITNDEGKQIYITPSRAYNEAKYEDDKTTTRKVGKVDKTSRVDNRPLRTTLNFFDLGPDYPNYYIDRNAEVFHIQNPNVHLMHFAGDRVYLHNSTLKRMVNVNRFKLFAIHVLGQNNIGPVHVEYFYFMYENRNKTNANISRNDVYKARKAMVNVEEEEEENMNDYYSSVVLGRYCGDDHLTDKRVQIIPDYIKYFKNRLLEFYKGFVFVFENRQTVYILNIISGKKVHMVLNNGILTFRLYRIMKAYNVMTKGYDYVREIVMVPLNKLHLDPTNEKFEIVTEKVVF